MELRPGWVPLCPFFCAFRFFVGLRYLPFLISALLSADEEAQGPPLAVVQRLAAPQRFLLLVGR